QLRRDAHERSGGGVADDGQGQVLEDGAGDARTAAIQQVRSVERLVDRLGERPGGDGGAAAAGGGAGDGGLGVDRLRARQVGADAGDRLRGQGLRLEDRHRRPDEGEAVLRGGASGVAVHRVEVDLVRLPGGAPAGQSRGDGVVILANHALWDLDRPPLDEGDAEVLLGLVEPLVEGVPGQTFRAGGLLDLGVLGDSAVQDLLVRLRRVVLLLAHEADGAG
ncbi:MAG: hypothetical protein ACK559_32410, partial [bacterium]